MHPKYAFTRLEHKPPANQSGMSTAGPNTVVSTLIKIEFIPKIQSSRRCSRSTSAREASSVVTEPGRAGQGSGPAAEVPGRRDLGGVARVWPRARSEGPYGLNSGSSIRVRGQSGQGLGGRSQTESRGLVWAVESFLGETAHLPDRL